MAQHHLAFPGSVTLRPTTLIAVVRDTVVSLARHGFTRFFFVNGHGGNIATVTAAFSEIYSERSMEKLSNQPSIKCALRNWWTGRASGSSRKNSIPPAKAVTPPLRSGAHLVQISRNDEPYPARAAHRANGSFADAEDYRRPSPMAALAPTPARRRPNRQALLRHRRRRGRARLREMDGALASQRRTRSRCRM